MKNSKFTTQGGIKIEKSITPLDAEHALNKIHQYIDIKKGALFVSNYEVPDRYSRWDLGFIHPALELIVRKQYFEINALNPNGTRLLKLIAPVLQNRSYLEKIVFEDIADQPALQISGTVKPRSNFFPEEERSRQPSIFSVIDGISYIGLLSDKNKNMAQ